MYKIINKYKKILIFPIILSCSETTEGFKNGDNTTSASMLNDLDKEIQNFSKNFKTSDQTTKLSLIESFAMELDKQLTRVLTEILKRYNANTVDEAKKIVDDRLNILLIPLLDKARNTIVLIQSENLLNKFINNISPSLNKDLLNLYIKNYDGNQVKEFYISKIQFIQN